MTKRTAKILERLDQTYGTDTLCYLNHDNAWQLLIAVILSAQCTDARVNIVTATFFKNTIRWKNLPVRILRSWNRIYIRLGFIIARRRISFPAARDLVTKFGGEVPSSIEDLTSLAGVGRKTANVIRGNIYHEPSIVVDTHVKRISNRLGFTKESDPYKIEQDLMKVLPKDHWILYNMQIITFGRSICMARSPKCSECFLQDMCKAGDKKL